MTKIRVFVFIIILVLLAGCTRTTQVKHEAVISLNDKIIEGFQEVSSIKTSIMRPTLTWDITVTDPSSCDEIFIDLLSMIKSEDVYSTLREYYKDYFIGIDIIIQNENSELIKKYTSSYYKQGTTIYGDDSKNEIDDFNTWVTNDFVQVGSDIYIYKKPLDYHFSYAEILGYDKNIPSFDPIDEETKLIYGLDEVTSFYETYIQSRELPMNEPDESSSLLFLQFKGDKFSAMSYSTSDIYISGNEITVELREIGLIKISPIEGFNGYFSYVIILEVDRSDVNEDMKVNVIVTE